jgi:hypothetical protein
MMHLENIKNLLLERPESFVTPFVLVVDPEDCPDIDHWDPERMSTWKYRVIGGNHRARAKQQLWDSYQRKVHRRIEAWVFAGLTRDEIHALGWTHNIDQEYRKSMSNIDRILTCHKIYLEKNEERSAELRDLCGRECALDGHILGNRASLQKWDPLFQIAFRTGKVWDVQEEIFGMWNRFELKNQKKQISPKKPKVLKVGKGKTQATHRWPLLKLAGELQLSNWRGLQGISNEAVILGILGRVKRKVISLEEMNQEATKYKKLVKIQQIFLQLSKQADWATCRRLFPKETDCKNLECFIGPMNEAVRFSDSKSET